MKTIKYILHLIFNSPWPFLCAMAANTTVLGLISYVSSSIGAGLLVFHTSFTVLLSLMGLWFKDVMVKSPHDDIRYAAHEMHVIIGVVLVIISETIFFLAFFGVYFRPNSPAIDLWYFYYF